MYYALMDVVLDCIANNLRLEKDINRNYVNQEIVYSLAISFHATARQSVIHVQQI